MVVWCGVVDTRVVVVVVVGGGDVGTVVVVVCCNVEFNVEGFCGLVVVVDGNDCVTSECVIVDHIIDFVVDVTEICVGFNVWAATGVDLWGFGVISKIYSKRYFKHFTHSVKFSSLLQIEEKNLSNNSAFLFL